MTESSGHTRVKRVRKPKLRDLTVNAEVKNACRSITYKYCKRVYSGVRREYATDTRCNRTHTLLTVRKPCRQARIMQRPDVNRLHRYAMWLCDRHVFRLVCLEAHDEAEREGEKAKE